MLKILDNNTNSSVKSRFNNKVFNGEVIVITTSIPLRYWYSLLKFENGGYDGLEQLYRRISTYVEINERKIKVYSNIDTKGNPQGYARIFKNELCGLKNDSVTKTDFVSVFEKICASSDVFEQPSEDLVKLATKVE